MKKISYISEIYAFHTIPPAVSCSNQTFLSTFTPCIEQVIDWLNDEAFYAPCTRVLHLGWSKRKEVLWMRSRRGKPEMEQKFPGNRFSSLAGTLFEWKVDCVTKTIFRVNLSMKSYFSPLRDFWHKKYAYNWQLCYYLVFRYKINRYQHFVFFYADHMMMDRVQ